MNQPNPTIAPAPETARTAHPNQTLWEKGDFTKIADLMRESGDELVAALNIVPPLRALDLGCGDGTTALPLAVRGADVLGVDIARNLVTAGERRAAAAGLTRLKFQEGDASNLSGLADASFDLTLSVFGAMFSWKPFDVARELVRVTRPGGRIVMGNWIPDDPTSFVSQLLRISSAYTPPPPPGFISPLTWGLEPHIVDRFAQAGVARDRIALERATFNFRSAQSTPEGIVELFRDYYGPTMNAYAAAAQHGKTDELHRQLVTLANQYNQAGRAGETVISATYLRVTVQR